MSPSFILYPFFFFFNDTATTEIYTLSLHDALPICHRCAARCRSWLSRLGFLPGRRREWPDRLWKCRQVALWPRSEEHTSELQSHLNLVCRLLLEKKKI